MSPRFVRSILPTAVLMLCHPVTLMAATSSGQAAGDDDGGIGLFLGGAVMLTVPTYFVLQAWAAFAWTGGWRKAALVPLIAIVPAMLWSLHALSHGSNLWPITVILLAPFGFVYLAILCVLRAALRRVEQDAA
jgi:hypothetical protein